jgi:hypothetical protein
MTDEATPAALEREGKSGAVLQWLKDRSSGGIRMGSVAGRREEAMERTGKRWIEQGGGRGDLEAVGGERWLGRDGSRGGFGAWVAAADPRRGKGVGGGGGRGDKCPRI